MNRQRRLVIYCTGSKTVDTTAPTARTCTPTVIVTTSTDSVPYSGTSDSGSGLNKVEQWSKKEASRTWTNSGCDIDSIISYSGTYLAGVNPSDSLTKTYSTVGKSSIIVDYARYCMSALSSMHFYSQWSVDGSTWTTLESVSGSSSWSVKSFNLPTDANNQSGFRIRFRTSSCILWQYAYLDDVKIIGM